MYLNAPECIYHGAVWSGTGYSEAARNAVLALARAGCSLQVDPSGFSKAIISVQKHIITCKKHQVNPALNLPLDFKELVTQLRYSSVSDKAPEVIHAPSPVYGKYAGRNARRTIGYTAWETGGMPEIWSDGCNKVDEVWIPCSHNLRVLRENGVRKSIYIVPHPIDHERFKPSQLRLNPIFTFISVFRWGLRKGWPELVTAYERAFSADDPVVLRILTNFRSEEYKNQAMQLLEHFSQSGKPRFEILPLEFVGYDFMPILYQNADVFVLPSRGEGFCLPCAEAMACGLPAIVTDATAFTDYVDEENGYPVAYREERSEDPNDPDRNATSWTVVDIDDLAEKMLIAYASRGIELQGKGALARETIIQKFNFERVARIMMERLVANGG